MAARKKRHTGPGHPNDRPHGVGGRFVSKQAPMPSRIAESTGNRDVGMGRGLGTDGRESIEVEHEITAELGSTGLRQYAGTIDEEFLPSLRGRRQIQVFQEMRDNDPTIGAMMFAVEMLMRQVRWTVEPGTTDEADVQLAEFVNSCRLDMSDTWEDTLASIFSFLPFGFSIHETVYKHRDGHHPEDVTRDSRFTDGRIGWRKLPVRAQDTVHRWIFNSDTDEVDGVVQLPPPDFRFRGIPASKYLLFRTTAAKANPQGRALAPETPIPTPNGFQEIGDLQVGDLIFDERGRIRHVTATATWNNRPRYAITFDAGETIIADAMHEWPTTLVWERSKRRPARIRTTEEIFETQKNSNGVSNHAIPLISDALEAPEQILPVEPWALGLWLGDGISRSGDIAGHADHVGELAELLGKAGYPVDRIEQNGPEGCLGRLMRVRGGFQAALRSIGVLGAKHIPEVYIRASAPQRAALLAGLLDSDGHITGDGQVEFCNTNRNLVDAVYRLAASLGEKPATKTRRKEGPSRSETWAVRWSHAGTFVPFRLRVKAARLRTDPIARRWHYVKTVDRIDHGRTVCIETDAPSHLFLAGQSLIPTHNSVLRNAYRPWYFKRRIEEIEGVGIERDLAGLPRMTVPAELMNRNATASKKALLAEIRTMLRDVRRDEREGIIVPQEYDKAGNAMYAFDLVRSGGRRQFDTTTIVNRYDRSIAAVVLADFILLGQQRVGSFALAESKTELFGVALGAWLDSVTAIFNRVGIPRLLLLNGIQVDKPPRLAHGDVEVVDLKDIGEYIAKLTGAGMPLFPDEKVENTLRNLGGLPEKTEDEGGDPLAGLTPEQIAELTGGGDIKPGSEAERTIGVAEGVQGQVLNGAQVTAIVDVATKAALGDISRESAVAILGVAFGFSNEKAKEILGPAIERAKLPPEPEPESTGGDVEDERAELAQT